MKLVVGAETLLGEDDEPGYLHGAGLIPASIARHLVGRSSVLRSTIQRLFHTPDGGLVAMERKTTRFPLDLREFITLRDQGTCRTPWCNGRIVHIDHADPLARGGPTSAINGQGLCEACNYAKEAPRWQHRPSAEEGTAATPSTSPPPPATDTAAPHPNPSDPDHHHASTSPTPSTWPSEGLTAGRGGDGSDQAELGDRAALLGELGGGGIDAGARELIDLESLDDLPVTVLVVTGNDEMRPSGTPYDPSETTAMETQSSGAEPSAQSRTGSTAPRRPRRPRRARAPR